MNATAAYPTTEANRPALGSMLNRVLRAPLTRRTWMETVYAVAALPLAIAGFGFLVISSLLGIVLSITLIGLPVLALGGLAARRLGSVHRTLARALLAEHVPPPARFVPDPGFFGWLQSALRDAASWRARAYLLAKLPLAVVTFYVVVLWAEALFWLIYPIWWQLTGLGGPLPFIDADTWPNAVAVALIGLVAVFAAPWAIRTLVWCDRQLIRSLLGRPLDAERVRELEHARARIADDAATTLRRIERDLHDGTQAQLGTLAMTLGQAKEKLEHRADVPYDPAGALDLIEAAHRHAKDALADVRDIARGIHPPALDLGLDPALATLVARSTIPATLHADLPQRPSKAIETITYFTVAELLANAAKHSRARRITVEITERGGTLHLQVRDDGVGGAIPGAGSGLTGLAERLHTVDGRLEIVSPPGGPTVITVELPLQA
jgi:signal transduction histidine kinase